MARKLLSELFSSVYDFGEVLATRVLDFVFPPSCVGCQSFGFYICPACANTIRYFSTPLCPGCMKPIGTVGVHAVCRKNTYLDGLRAVCHHDGVIASCIHQIKYAGYYDMLRTLVSISLTPLGELINDQSIQALVPIPLHRQRLMDRGYNQTELLCTAFSRKLSIPVKKNILIKRKKTDAQAGLDRSKRLLNIKGAFSCPGRFPKGARLLLIDDVCTTGSTLSECAQILKKAGATRVYGFVIAHGK